MYHYETASDLQAVYDQDVEGYSYSRDGTPNATELAEKISWLEGAAAGVMTASGMTALTAVFLSLLESGDSIATASQLYGRSLLLANRDLPRMGFASTQFDASDSTTFQAAIRPGTRIVLAEIVSNPMLRLTYFNELVQATKAVGATLVVDNTFTTPAGFNPLAHGADLVMHSVTKMLSGHSDLNLGYLGGRDPTLIARIDETVKTMGLNASPYNCWLAERGLHTFELRFERAQENAMKLANLLEAHPMVARVHYPGLASHPDHTLARDMLTEGYGSMVSFVLKGVRTEADAFLKAAENIPYGPTLGDVATIVIMPAVSSHRKLSRPDRLALGIEDNLVRVSMGIENFGIIAQDFSKALDCAAQQMGAA